MLKKIFSWIYLTFSIFLLLAIFKNRTKLELILILFFSIFMCFVLRKNKKIKLNDRNCYLLIGLAILVRIGLIFLNYGEVYSDYASFFYGAIDFANSGTISKYVAVFPHLISYILILGGLFKIFGASYKLVIICNIFFDLISAFMLMKMLKSKKVILVWLLNPINIIWCGICHPVVVTNTFFIMSIFAFYNLVKKFDSNEKKVYLLAILFGLVLVVTNLFRPIMIIFVIALLIYFVLNLNKNNLKKTGIVVGIILILFFGGNKLSMFIYRTCIDDSIASKTFGWSMYVGANIDSTGSWNQTQQYELDDMLDSSNTPTEIHEYFLDKGIDLYKSNGILNNMKLFVDKVIVLVGKPDWLSAAVFNLMMEKPLYDNIYLLLRGITLVSSNMFVEVAERYSMPLLVPYTLLLIINIDKVLKRFSQKKII